MSEQKRVSYYNTLIFTIISSIVSLLLLVALFFDIFKDYMPFIITVEIGIFLVISYCIYRIISNESLLDKYKKANNFSIDFTTCPDYFVKKNDGNNEYCSNEYMLEDEYRNKKLMKVYPVDVSLPASHTSQYASPEIYDKFITTSIESEPMFRSVRDKCSAAALGQHPSNSASTAYNNYKKIPWVGVKARCESYF